jgi:hypothetical protein
MGGVEEVSVEVFLGEKARDGVWSAVEGVADDGVAEGLSVNADLVGSPGLDANLGEGEGTIRGYEAFQNVEMGDSRAAIGTASGHAGASDEVAGDGEVYGGVIFLEVAVEERQVSLRHLAAGEHLAEFAVGAVVFGNEDEATGELVEAMDDAWAEIATDVGELGEVE